MKPTQVGDKIDAHNPQTSAPSLIVYDPLAQPLVAAVYLQGLLTANLALRYVWDIVKVERGMLCKDEGAGDLGIWGSGLCNIQSDVAIKSSSSSAAKTNSVVCQSLRSCESTITTPNCAKNLSLPGLFVSPDPVMVDPRTCSPSSSCPCDAKLAVAYFASVGHTVAFMG